MKGSKYKIGLCFSALFWPLAALAQMSTSEAFELGKVSGEKANTSALRDQMTNARGSELINGFSTTPPPQSSYWTGSNTSLNTIFAGGNDRVSECTTTGGKSSDPMDNGHCQAVNAIVKSGANRPPNLVTNTDPLLLKGRTISADPDSIAGSIDGTYSNCTTKTITRDAPFTIETCDDFAQSATNSCRIGQEVKVDADFLYQCTETLKTIQSSTCSVGTVIKVGTQYNYQCTRSPAKQQTSNCNRTAVVNIVYDYSIVPQAPGTVVYLDWMNTGYTRDIAGIRVTATSTPWIFTVDPMRNFVGRVSAAPPNVSVSAADTNGYAMWASGVGDYARYWEVKINCVTSTGICNVWAHSWYTSGWTNDGYLNSSFNGATKFEQPVVKVTWNNQCATFEQRAK